MADAQAWGGCLASCPLSRLDSEIDSTSGTLHHNQDANSHASHSPAIHRPAGGGVQHPVSL